MIQNSNSKAELDPKTKKSKQPNPNSTQSPQNPPIASNSAADSADPNDPANGYLYSVFGKFTVNLFWFFIPMVILDIVIFIGGCIGVGDNVSNGKFNAFAGFYSFFGDIKNLVIALAIIDLIFDVVRLFFKTLRGLKITGDANHMCVKLVIWSLLDLLQWIFLVVITAKTNEHRTDISDFVSASNIGPIKLKEKDWFYNWAMLVVTFVCALVNIFVVACHLFVNILRTIDVGKSASGSSAPSNETGQQKEVKVVNNANAQA